MSANDYLLLTKRGNKYRLSHRDADTNAEFEHWEFAELEEALAKAEEEQGEIEYGLVFGEGVKLKTNDALKQIKEVKKMSAERETPLEFMESQVFGLEMTEEQILENARKKKRGTPQRVGLELDDEQLSQVPNPQVVKKDKKPLNLGSFWKDEY